MTEKNFLFYASIVMAAVLIGLAVTLIRSYQKSPAVRYYALFLLSLATIGLIHALLFLTNEQSTLTLMTRFGYLAGTLTFSFLLMFSLYYPIPGRVMGPRTILWWLLPVVFFVPYIFFNPNFIFSVEPALKGFSEHHGWSFVIFPVFVLAYCVMTLMNLFGKWNKVQGRQQRDLQIFSWIFVLTLALAFIFDVVLLGTGTRWVPIGLYSAFLLCGFSTYIVRRK